MGVEALEAERSALQQRKTDDFTESRVAQIAKELQLLKSNREVEVLKQRQNEDVFLKGVEPLRAEVVRLGNLSNLDISALKLVSVDRKALAPTSPIKPRKALILLLGLVLGAMLGVLIVLVRYFMLARNASLHASASPVLPATLGNGSGAPNSGKVLQNDRP